MPVAESVYHTVKEASVRGRYLPLDLVLPLLKKLPGTFQVTSPGTSVKGAALYQIRIGRGNIKVLMWSQMHGNETTTTKAILDLLGYLASSEPGAGAILDACTIQIIPVLNPDGAAAYTRFNANEVDLNRDAQALTQPESQTLRKAFDDFNPDFCFNLHDQRTIFSVGESPQPATLSFLAPAHDEERSVSASRASSMKLIAAINHSLQKLIPGQVGRYDDAFNLNCVGDTFQALNTPTLLFEAGHFPGDYAREHTRYLVFQALVAALTTISDGSSGQFTLDDYYNIPQNQKRFLDIIIRNPRLLDVQWETGINLGVQFKEELREGSIHFTPHFQEVGLLSDKYGHKIYDADREEDRLLISQNRALLSLLK